MSILLKNDLKISPITHDLGLIDTLIPPEIGRFGGFR